MEMIRRKMPTTTVLLIFSWLIAIAGFITAVYLFIFKFSGVNSLLSNLSILLGSLLFAASVRMLGNIGQVLFDLQSLKRESTNETKDVLNQNFNSLTQNIEALRNSFEKSTNETKDVLNQNFNSLTQNIEALRNSFEKSTNETKDVLNQNFNSLTQNLRTQLEAQTATLTHTLQDLNQSLAQNIEALRNSFNLIISDSNEINKNVHQIKNFFEEVERE